MFSFLTNWGGGTQYQQAYPIFCRRIDPSSLGYATNNLYSTSGFPPLMADGRAVVASYQPEAVRNNDIIAENGIKTNWEYRQYLVKNAKSIINDDFKESANDCGYYKRFVTPPVIQYNKRLYDTYELQNGEQMTDLKNVYLAREQLAERQGYNR